jgi:hypothetical protein
MNLLHGERVVVVLVVRGPAFLKILDEEYLLHKNCITLL